MTVLKTTGNRPCFVLKVAVFLFMTLEARGAIVHVHHESFSLSPDGMTEENLQFGTWEPPVRLAGGLRGFGAGYPMGAWPLGVIEIAGVNEGDRDRAWGFSLHDLVEDEGLVSWIPLEGGLNLADHTDGSGFFYDTEAFMGVRILDENDYVYAWIRISYDASAGVLTVHEWAWNTVLGEPILAGQIPEPATVALFCGLAALLGVLAVRRRRKE